jgi:hypothetical protein
LLSENEKGFIHANSKLKIPKLNIGLPTFLSHKKEK